VSRLIKLASFDKELQQTENREVNLMQLSSKLMMNVMFVAI